MAWYEGVDWTDPINRDCPLNAGLAGWWMGAPSLFGGGRLWDLLNRNHGTLTNMDPATDWVANRNGTSRCLNFLRTSSQYVAVNPAPVLAMPLTMMCWFRSTDVTNAQELLSLADAASEVNYHAIELRGDVVGDPVWAQSRSAAGTANAAATIGYTSGVWYHAAAVFASATSRTIYLNGANNATNTTSRTPIITRFAIGTLYRLSITQYTTGDIDDVRLFDRALSQAEIQAIIDDSNRGHADALNRPRRRVYSVPDEGGGGGGTPFVGVIGGGVGTGNYVISC